MLHVLVPIVILSLNFDNDSRFLDVVKNISSEKSMLKWINSDEEIDALLMAADIRRDEFRFHYLMRLKSDINKLKKIEQLNEVEIKKNVAVFSENNNISGKNPATIKRIDELLSARKKLLVIFGEFSYVDLMVSTDILAIKMASAPEKNFAEDIDAEMQRFEGSDWSNSPMLSQFYLLKCASLRSSGAYGLMYKNSIIAKKMREKLCANKADPAHLGPVSYEFESLCLQGKYNDVINLYKSVPGELLESTSEKYLNAISVVYSSLASSYFEIGKIDLAITYQEIALGKAYQCFSDRDYPVVRKQAIKLRDILKKKGDLAAMQAVEERFNLKAAPN